MDNRVWSHLLDCRYPSSILQHRSIVWSVVACKKIDASRHQIVFSVPDFLYLISGILFPASVSFLLRNHDISQCEWFWKVALQRELPSHASLDIYLVPAEAQPTTYLVSRYLTPVLYHPPPNLYPRLGSLMGVIYPGGIVPVGMSC